MSPQRPRQRLYLITPQLGDTASFARDIGAALEAGDIAAVLLRLEPADERTLVDRAKAIAAVAQRRDIALILDGHSQIVARAGAGGLRSRHDAMLAGEASADYVMFGEPDGGGGRPSSDAIEDRLVWWSELFEAPCVGYAANLDEVGPLAQAGADFVALGDWIWTPSQGSAAVVAEAASRLATLAAP